MNHQLLKSTPIPCSFFGSIRPPPALSPLILLKFLSFKHADFTVSFFQLCFSHLLSVLLCHICLCFFFKSGSSSTYKTTPKHLPCPLRSLCDYSYTFCPVWSVPLSPPCLWVFSCLAMLEHMSRRSRSLLSLTLTTLALALSILALCTSYWCEGTHKVVKPLCLSPVKMKNCGQNNSEPYTTGTFDVTSKHWEVFSAARVFFLSLCCFCGFDRSFTQTVHLLR